MKATWQLYWLVYQQKRGHGKQAMVPIMSWVLQMLLLLLCVQPFDKLWDYQKVGLLWLTLMMTLLRSVQETFAQEKILSWVEQDRFSAYSPGLWWRTQLAGLWLAHARGCVIALPLVGMWFGIDGGAIVRMLLLWLCLSPSYYLLWMCLHSISVGVTYGAVIVMVLMVPWMVPSMLWAHEVLLAYQLNLESAGYWYCLLGSGVIGVVWLPKIVDVLTQEGYTRLRCES